LKKCKYPILAIVKKSSQLIRQAYMFGIVAYDFQVCSCFI